MTAGERLKMISGDGDISASSRLKRIGGSALTATALLIAYSLLNSGTASTHLLTDKVNKFAYFNIIAFRRKLRR